MVGESLGGVGKRVSIAEQDVIDVAEIEAEVRTIEEQYKGEERISRLVEYICLTITEVTLIKNTKSVRVTNLDADTIETIKNLSAGAISADETREG